MGGMDSQEGQPFMCGAVMRPRRLPIDNARINTSETARAHFWSIQAVLVVKSGHAEQSDAFAVFLRIGLGAGLAVMTAAERAEEESEP
jgi:hypothetical protein